MVRKIGHPALAIAVTLAIGGCSVATPPHLAHAQAARARPTTVGIESLPEGQKPSELDQRFDAAVRTGLARSGVSMDPASPNRLTVAFVQHAASLGVTQRKDGVPSGKDWLSEPRAHHWYDGCQAQRFEATLVLSQASGTDAPGLARGAFDSCGADDAQLQRLAEILVKALLGN